MKYLLVTIMFLVCSCDVNVGNGDGDKGKQDLSYQYDVNGCDTGKHSFSSLTDYCLGLANDDINNFCASQARCARFKEACVGLDLGVTCD